MVMGYRLPFLAAVIIILILLGTTGFLLVNPQKVTSTVTSTVSSEGSIVSSASSTVSSESTTLLPAPITVTSTVTSTTTSENPTLTPEVAGVTVAATSDTYLNSGSVDMATMQGLFSKEGLTANLIITPNAVQALEAGQVQFAITQPPFAADAQGGSLVAVGVLVPSYPAAIIAAPGITSLSQLQGKTFGCTTASGLVCTVEKLFIASQNWTASSPVEALGSLSALEAAFESGQVQGFVYDWAVAVQLQSQGQANIVGNLQQYVPSWYSASVVTTTQFAASNPNTVRLFLTALYQSNLWLSQNANATESWLMSHYSYNLDAAETVYNDTGFSLTGIMQPSVIELMYNQTATAQNLPPVNWQTTYTNEYLPTITYVPAT
jgi:ABC-type nitrate/sulfonate/bicarbonate transport system substrate-binding protein